MKHKSHEKRLEAMFAKEKMNFSGDRKCKEAAVYRLGCAIKEKKIVPQASVSEIIRNQIRFMEKKILAVQFLCFVLILAVYVSLRGELAENDFYLMGMASSVLFSLFTTLGCVQEETNGIAELAGSCFFNNRQACTLRILLYAGFDVIFLTVITFGISQNVERNLWEVSAYLLVPFLAAGCFQLGVMLSNTVKKSGYVVALSVCFMTAVFCAAASWPRLYEKAMMGGWVLALIISSVVYCSEVACLLQKMEKGELLCMS